MDQFKIKQYGQLEEKQKEKAVEIFIEGFKHLMTFSKDEEELKALFSTSLNPSLLYTYIEKDKVLGIIGIATNHARPIRLVLETCIHIYGRLKGTIFCKQMNVIFQSQVVKGDYDLYIDVLATTKEARGRGIATKLIEFAFSLENYENYYIEVFSKNVNAKRLYEKTGFETYKKSKFSFIARLGQGYPIKMKRGTKDATKKL